MRLPYGTVSAEEQAHLIALTMEWRSLGTPVSAPPMTDTAWVALDVLRADGGWLTWPEWIVATARALWLGLSGSIPWRLAYERARMATGTDVFSLHHQDPDTGRTVRLVGVSAADHYHERVHRAREFVALTHPPLNGTRWVLDDGTVPPVRNVPAPAWRTTANLVIEREPDHEVADEPAQLSLLEAA
ncbi:hypothetical protein [Microcystis phage Mae-JY09]